MQNKLFVSSSPHLNSPDTTRGIMLDVLIALTPAAAFSVYLFGARVVYVIAAAVFSCVLSEYIIQKIMKRAGTVSDLSAAVTGLLVAFNLPPSIPLWIAALGGAVAIVIMKQLFGGIGRNFVNPALGARIVLLLSFPAAMTNWTSPTLGRMTAAAPLALIKEGEPLKISDLLIGLRAGCIGETSVIFLTLGGLYLLLRRVIDPVIPVTYIGSVALLTFLLGADPLYHILTGGLFLGAVFMATDYTTSPLTIKGRFIFAIGCGIVTTLIRIYGSLPEGVSYSIVFMNILVPHIDRLTASKPFGMKGPEWTG